MNNNRRYNSNWINDDEVNRQIGELADTTRIDHYQEVIDEQKANYQRLSDGFDSGELSPDEAKALKMMHRINRIVGEQPNEKIDRQKEVQAQINKVSDKIRELQRLPNSTSGEVGVKINNLYVQLLELERKL